MEITLLVLSDISKINSFIRGDAYYELRSKAYIMSQPHVVILQLQSTTDHEDHPNYLPSGYGIVGSNDEITLI